MGLRRFSNKKGKIMALEDKTTLEEVFAEWVFKVEPPIIALETGCSSEWKPEYLPFLSTPNLAKCITTDGTLYSIDNNTQNIKICKTHIGNLGLTSRVMFVIGESLKSIATCFWFNFVWLDSAEDSAHAVKEFLLVQRYARMPYVLCVDDYGNPNSKKWQVVSEIIKLTAIEWKTYDTPTGLIVGLMGE